MRAIVLSTRQLFLAWTASALLVSLGLVLVVLTLGQLNERLGNRIVRLWGRTMLRVVRVKLELSGAHHLEGRAPRVVVFNHASMLDLFVASAILPEGGVAAVKRELLFYPFLGLAVWMFGFVIIDRKNRARAQSSLEKAAARIKNERMTVLISPEGTRTRDGSLLPFKLGALHLARAAEVPVVAMALHGCFELMPNGRLYCEPGVVRVEVLGPQPIDDIADVRVAAEVLRETLSRALGTGCTPASQRALA